MASPRADRRHASRGLLWLFLFLLLFFGLRYLLSLTLPPSEPPATEWQTNKPKGDSNSVILPQTPFYIQTTDATTLASYGLPNYLAQRIIKYREAGGKFYAKSDLLKIYGMTDSLYSLLAPFIRFPEKRSSSFSSSSFSSPPPRYPRAKPRQIFELNEGTAEDFMQVHGIGVWTAKRILDFRERLGGFARIEQLFDVYKMDSNLVDSLFCLVFLDSQGRGVRKLNINCATEEELRSHPYIDWRIAKLIVAYRKQHGDYPNLEQLNAIKIMRKETFERMAPYLDAAPSSDSLRGENLE